MNVRIPSRLRLLLSTALLALLTFGVRPALAQAPGSDTQVTVTIGSVRCFVVRCPDGALTATDRVDQIQAVFAKHLGSPRGEFTTRQAKGSSRLDILLNGDLVISVTTNDARATRFQKPADIATDWKRSLERAFEATHALPISQHK
jgi:hypothetical protein